MKDARLRPASDAFDTRLSLEQRLRTELVPVLGAERCGALSFLFINGWRMDYRNLSALAFEPGGARPALVAKVGAGAGRAQVSVEHANLKRLGESRDERLRASVPRVLAYRDGDQQTLLIESTVAGDRVPLPNDERAATGLVCRVVDWLLLFHAETQTSAPALGADATERLFGRPIRRYLEGFRPTAAERRYFERMLQQVERLANARLPLVYLHGDLCPQNLLDDGGRALGVIDWELPFAPRLPGYDLIHFLACLGEATATDDDYRLYERAFFEDTPIARAARVGLERYARGLALTPDVMRLLFAQFWVDYTLEKLEDRAETAADGARPEAQGTWTLAKIEDGSCLNLQRLAAGDPPVLR